MDFYMRGQVDFFFSLEEASLRILARSDDFKLKCLNNSSFVSYKHAVFQFTRHYLINLLKLCGLL